MCRENGRTIWNKVVKAEKVAEKRKHETGRKRNEQVDLCITSS